MPRKRRSSPIHAKPPPDRLADCGATVIGLGALGRNVAWQLAALGVPRLQLVDPARVARAQATCEGYFFEDIGRTKAHATAELVHRVNPAIEVSAHVGRFKPGLETHPSVFCCVRNLRTRKTVWRSVSVSVGFFADGRFTKHTLRVLAVCDARSQARYARMIQRDAAKSRSDGAAGRGAETSRTATSTAAIAAGLMVDQFTRFLRGDPPHTGGYPKNRGARASRPLGRGSLALGLASDLLDLAASR